MSSKEENDDGDKAEEEEEEDTSVANSTYDMASFHVPIVRKDDNASNQSAQEKKQSSPTSDSQQLPPGQPLHLRTMEEFTDLSSSHGNVTIVVDFGASWCGPCRSIAPHFQQLAQMYGDKIIFCKVDTDESKSLSSAANISSLPTFVFYRNGVEAERMTGANQTQLDELVQAAVMASTSTTSSSAGETKEKDDTVDLSQLTRYESTAQLSKALRMIHSHNDSLRGVEERRRRRRPDSDERADLSLSSEEMLSIESLVGTLTKDNMWHASTIRPNEMQTLRRILLQWPLKYSLPAIDVARVVVLHPDGLVEMEKSASDLLWLVAQHSSPPPSFSSSSPNVGIALKCLANTISMCTLQRRPVSSIHGQLYKACSSNVSQNDRRTREALTSVVLNATTNVLTFGDQTEENMSSWIGMVSLLLMHEGKCKDATGMLVVKKCLNSLSMIAKHAPSTCKSWIILGNAVTTIKSSDYSINSSKKILLDTISKLVQRQKRGVSKVEAIPNPWA